MKSDSVIIDKKYAKLLECARDAMKNSYAPYSKCNVGAALLTNDGAVYTGCNVENASFSLTCCAERTAIFKAVSEGCKEFEAIAIIGGYDGEVSEVFYPCGACRQVMTEFCNSDFKIILTDGKCIEVVTLGEMMPYLFGMDKVIK